MPSWENVPDLDAAFKARLRHVEIKQCRSKGRLAGYNAAHYYTGLCPCPRRHRNLCRKVAVRARFIRELHATLAAMSGGA